MPKRTDIKKVLVIGSGPIVIGQAAEFDYAGTQACLALREEGYYVILANSNPATIMTDTTIADKVITGNSLMVLALAERVITPAQLLRNWLTVYLGNAAGGIAVAALAVYSHTASLFGGGLARSMVSIAASKAALGFGDAFLRGILCNLLVCLAVWMAAGAKRPEGKLPALFFPIMLFVLCGYEHCIANLYYLPAGAFAAAEYGIDAALPLSGCLRNLAAVTLGNLVGGASLGLAYRFAYLKK